jgi:plasmid replication initiation protein|nr:MAG TPA: DNA REPLICATION protein [Caudoviricetes sp.]
MKDSNTLKNQVIAMSNILAKKSTRFSVTQQKLFYASLASLKYGVNERNEVRINKQELFNLLGMESDNNRWSRLRKELRQLAENSYIEYGEDKEFKDGFLIYSFDSNRDRSYIFIRFNDDYLPLIKGLSNNFVRFLDDDLVTLKSKYSMMLYQNLMKDKWKMSNIDFMGIDYSTTQLKNMFGLSKESYMNRDGFFNRADFERNTLNKAIKELNEKCKCINNLKYEKIKKNGRVQYYKFSFDYTDPQSVADESNERKGKSIIDSMQKQSEEFSEEIKNLNWWD